jgi:hypothetical protein
LDEKFYKDKSLYELRYTQKGICSSIEWKKICDKLQEISKTYPKSSLYIEWYQSLGDWIEKDSLITTVYGFDNDKLHDKNFFDVNCNNDLHNFNHMPNKYK